MMGVLQKREVRACVLSLLLAVVLLAPKSSLSSEGIASDSLSASSLYYTVDEERVEVFENFQGSSTQTWNNNQMMTPFLTDAMISGLKQVVVNLLKWAEHNQTLPDPEEKYLRKLHFGRWINDPYDDTCMNTRARVLSKTSEVEVTYRGNRNCVVDSGLWNEPYAGKTVEVAREIQIDHMVPLKNAYISGAWQWDYKTRCLYSNYMSYNNHLIPSDASQNMSKGDRAPDKYLPVNEAYRCQYVRDWLAVKLIWKLNMTQEEVQAIGDTVEHYNCDPNSFKFTQEELQKQRNEIHSNLDFCMINKR